jgi:hypothetical protein
MPFAEELLSLLMNSSEENNRQMNDVEFLSFGFVIDTPQ